jgi:hypothetical protein
MFRCVVCAEAWETLFGFFCREPQALMTDPGAVEALRGSKGFCAFHEWMLTRYASPRNLSQAMPSLLEDASAGLLTVTGQDGASASRQIRQMLGAPSLCPACRLLRETEQQIVDRVRDHLLSGTSEGDPPTLCLRHLAEVLPGLGGEQAALLLQAQAKRGEALAEALKGYASKFDTLRRSQITEEERDAHRDALVFLTGERDLAGPSAWRHQDPV